MRRFLAVLSLTAFAAGALAGAALAKEGGVELTSLPVGVEPGDPWETNLRLVGGTPAMLAEAKPGLTIRNFETGQELTFPARPMADPHEHYVRIVFPGGGVWSVEAYDGISGHSYTVGGGQFFVAGPTKLPVATRSAPVAAGFPLWPVVGGGPALVLAAAGFALLRRQRSGSRTRDRARS